jgi:CRISPR system Cascade subunit CasD
MNTLFLRLEGPMQSWGRQDKSDFRAAGDMPTRSGVVGLLGAALGIRSGEGLRELSQSIQFAVRVDNAGIRMVDFQTANEKYRQADGGSKPVDYRQIINKEYLAGASFLVAVRGNQETIERLAAAVRRPKWPYFLGRKSCPPSARVFAGVGEYDDLVSALREYWPDGKRQASARVESPKGNLVIQDRTAPARRFGFGSYQDIVLEA